MLEEQHRDLSAVKIWALATRPKTLPAAAAPVIVGASLAYSHGGFQLGASLACLAAALLLQIGANLANDVFDYQRGADVSGRLGPVRVTQSGMLTPRQVQTGMWASFGLAALFGLYLVGVAGWPVVMIGLASIAAAFAYTGGPLPFGYYGLGDLFVFIFFGLAAVCGTYFVNTLRVNWIAMFSALPMGFLITAILVVNNLRDIETDRLVRKMTLAVKLGVNGTRREYLLCLVCAYLIPLGLWLVQAETVWIMITWLSAIYAYRLVITVWQVEGHLLNLALAETSRLTLLYAVLFSLGVILPQF